MQTPPLSPGLYLVATPIGNLEDITLRALRVLRSADLILAEDTRTSGKLLKHYGISTPMKPYHEHNAARVRDQVLAALEGGQALALISDAGTPLVSDPGYKLVTAALEAAHPVIPIPGPSAVLSALSVSSLPPEPFVFAGFPPAKSGARCSHLQRFVTTDATLIFYESPHRLLDSLRDMVAVFGPRPAAVARELTKLYESCVRGPLPEIIAHYEAESPRGEIVVLIGPPDDTTTPEVDIDAALNAALAEMSPSAAAAHVAKATGIPKRDLYARAVELKNG